MEVARLAGKQVLVAGCVRSGGQCQKRRWESCGWSLICVKAGGLQQKSSHVCPHGAVSLHSMLIAVLSEAMLRGMLGPTDGRNLLCIFDQQCDGSALVQVPQEGSATFP